MARLTDAQVALLRERNFGVVATAGRRGRLQTSVVWVDTDGEHVVFNTTNARAKGRNLRETPRASITVWVAGDPYRYLEVEGPVELEEEGAAEHINSLSRRYEGRDFANPTDRVIVRIIPERVFDRRVSA